MAERLLHLRTIRGLTQAALAKKAGITQPTYSLIETGETQELDGRTLHGLCKALETNGDYIYEGGARPARIAALTHDERELLDTMRALPEPKQAELLNYARYLLQQTAAAPIAAHPFPRVKAE